MVRKSSGIPPRQSPADSSAGKVDNSFALGSGTADVGSSPQSRPDDQGAVPASVLSLTLPTWVLSHAPDSSVKPVKSEPEKLTTSEDYLTAVEVAAVLRVSLRTVRRLLAQGHIPHIRVGRQVRIPRETLTDRGQI